MSMLMYAMNGTRTGKTSPAARWPIGGGLLGALAVCLILPLAACDQIKHEAAAASAAATSPNQPPQAFLDTDVLQPQFGGAVGADLTVGQISDFYGSTGSWRKVAADTYILDVNQTDEVTHKPQAMSVEFKTTTPAANWTGWQACQTCVQGQPFVQITRVVINGDDGDFSDIDDLEHSVLKGNVPLSPTAATARNQRIAQLAQTNQAEQAHEAQVMAQENARDAAASAAGQAEQSAAEAEAEANTARQQAFIKDYNSHNGAAAAN